jgi:uncharacterized protein
MNRCYLIDTNVVVAGLLASQADSATARVLDGMLQAAFPFVLSTLLLAECRAVLLRPKIQKAHGLTPDQIDTVLTDVALAGMLVDPEPGLSSVHAPDPGDRFLWNLLEQRPGLELVTGDLRLSQDPVMRSRVITPRVLIDRFGH